MKKITLTLIISALLLNISCDSIKTAVNTVTNNNPVKSKYRMADVPRNIKNAKPDAHAVEETAIIVTVYSAGNYFVGEAQYPLETVAEKIIKLLEKTPAERQLIYLIGSSTVEYLEILKVIDTIRKRDVENLSLVVMPEVKTDALFHILKVKLMPEPKYDDPETDEYYKMAILNLSKDGKINFARNDKKAGFTLDKTEIKPEEMEAKIKQILKEREEKKVFRTGTNEVDKRIYIKTTKSNKYGEIVKLVDAAIGAGAEVYLQIDDLPE